MNGIQQRVLEVVRSADAEGDVLRPRDVIKALPDLDSPQVYSALAILARKAILNRSGHGFYELGPQAPPPPAELEAAEALEALSEAAQPAEVRFCWQCRHAEPVTLWGRLTPTLKCAADPVNAANPEWLATGLAQDRMLCADARAEGFPCGVDARYFELRAET